MQDEFDLIDAYANNPDQKINHTIPYEPRDPTIEAIDLSLAANSKIGVSRTRGHSTDYNGETA